MTGLETVLLLAIAALTAQVLILQRHYNERLSDQATILTLLLDLVEKKGTDPCHLAKIRDKIYDSSQ